MQRPKFGFTLVELAVVLVIVGLLAALLIPAVHSVREASRKSACQNKLRQIAVAIQSHESANGNLPSLYFGSFLQQPRNALDEFHFHSWQTAILPQLEQVSLYDKIDLSRPATDSNNQANLNAIIPEFHCPSFPNQSLLVQDVLAWNDGKTSTIKVGTAARSDFEAVAGVNFPRPVPSVSSDLRGIRFGAWGEPNYDVETGKSKGYRIARFRDVSDGLSNTILVGERAGRPDWYRRGKPVDPYPYTNPGNGMDHHQAAWGISTHIWWMIFSFDQSINDTNATGVYSFHSSGANVALADGSVRFLSEQIDQKTLQALATRSNGDDVDLD